MIFQLHPSQMQIVTDEMYSLPCFAHYYHAELDWGRERLVQCSPEIITLRRSVAIWVCCLFFFYLGSLFSFWNHTQHCCNPGAVSQHLDLSSGHLRMGRGCQFRSLATFRWCFQLRKDGLLLPPVFGRSLGLSKRAETWQQDAPCLSSQGITCL